MESIEQIRARVKQAQKNYHGNMLILEGILRNERGYVSRVPENEDVVVLCSGGLDSSVLIQKIIEDWNVKVHPLFIRRGARAEKWEEKAFDFFLEFYEKRFPDNMKDGFKLEYKLPPLEFRKCFPSAMALTVGHPLRNSTMQNLAVMYAVSIKGRQGIDVKTILTGSVAEDNTEPELGLLSLRAQTLSTCVQLGDWEWNITSPLSDYYLVEKPVSKKDLIEYSIQKFIPLEKTRTCFGADKIACGECFACKKRLKAFEELGVHDLLKYGGKNK